MKYISRQTREVFFWDELCHLLGIYIEPGEVSGEWEPVYLVEPPKAELGFHVMMGPIDLDPKTDRFIQTYIQDPITIEPIRVPAVIDAFQGKAVLISAGLYGDIEAFINSAQTPDIYRAAWVSAKTWERNSAFVVGMLQLMGKTSEEGDQLFIAASQIQIDSMLS